MIQSGCPPAGQWTAAQRGITFCSGKKGLYDCMCCIAHMTLSNCVSGLGGWWSVWCLGKLSEVSSSWLVGNPYPSRGDSLVIIAVTSAGLVPVLAAIYCNRLGRMITLCPVITQLCYNLIGITKILTDLRLSIHWKVDICLK